MKLKRIIALLVVTAALLLLVVGCMPEKKDDGKVNAPETTPPDNQTLVDEVNAIPFKDFVIVRGEKADDDLLEVASEFRKQIMKLVGGKAPNIESDKKGEAAKEILVGNTNRKSAAGLLRTQFQITFRDGKLAILGGSDKAISEGVTYFIENLACKNGVLCAEGYSYTSPRGDGYKVTSVSIGGKKQAGLPVLDSFESKEQLGIALDAIEAATGIPCEPVDSEDKAVLVFTTDTKKFGLTENQWALTAKDGKLYIVAETLYGKQDAVSYIKDIMSGASGDFVFEDKKSNVLTKEEYLSQDRLVIFPEYPEQIRRNYDYKVTVSQGDKSAQIPVYNHTMEYDLHDRGSGGDMYRRFSQFAFSGKQARVDIKVGRDFESYTVMPSAKKFKTEYKDGVISVFLDKPEYFAVRLDNDDNSIISVFADYPEFPRELPDKNDPNVIWVEGWYEPKDGILNYDSKTKNKTIYIAPGAVLNARVNFQYGATGCKILGLGAIVDPFENIYEYDITVGGSEGGYTMVKFYGYDHVYDGPVILDARTFNITACGNNITVRNAKILSTMMTTDGISLFNGNNYDVDHCYIYCGDNAIVYSTSDNPDSGSVNYNDITIGTTCAAIFPQGHTNDGVLTNIYVFRADAAIINCTLGGTKATHDLTVKNLDAIDCTYTPSFFNSHSIGTIDNKTFVFENISLPATLGVSDGHNIAGKTATHRLISLSNSSSNPYADNYKVSFKNVYVGTRKIENLSDVNVNDKGKANVITLENDGTYKPAPLNRHEVNYDFKGNVYIGLRLLSFNYDTIVEGNEFYLSAAEIAEYLRTNAKLTAVEKNGAQYVKASDLVSAGAAKSIEVKNGDLHITPVYNGENLLLPDKGEISYWSEETCFHVELLTEVEDEDVTFILQGRKELRSGGISRKITNEVKMYGAGTYTLTFDIRGAVSSSIKFAYARDKAETALAIEMRDISVEPRWNEFNIDIVVTEGDIQADSITFYLRMNGDVDLTYFEMRDIKLVKTK